MYRDLLIRLRNLFVNPLAEWSQIHRESTTFNDMLGHFALPQIGIVTLGVFLSHLINQQVFIFELALKMAILVFIALFGGLFFAWYIVFRLMKYFQFISSRELAAKLAIYSSAPLYVASLAAALVPEFFFVHVLVVYSFYLTWTGVKNLAGSESDRKFIFSLIIGVMILSIPYMIRVILLNLLTI